MNFANCRTADDVMSLLEREQRRLMDEYDLKQEDLRLAAQLRIIEVEQKKARHE